MTAWSELATVDVAVLLNGVWVDIARPYVLTHDGTPIRWSDGRQSELGDDEPASGSLVLLNNDHRFTVGNSTSPLFPYWAQGRQIRIREQVGSETFETFGILEISDDSRTANANADRVAANLTDQLGRLQSMPTFVSTLAEHIRYVGSTTLKAYWPCIEAAEPFPSLVNTSTNPEVRSEVLTSTILPVGEPAQLLPQEGEMPPGEDASTARLTYSTDAAGTAAWSKILRANYSGFVGNVELTPGTVFTAAAWIGPDTVATSPTVLIVTLQEDLSALALIDLTVSGGTWVLTIGSGGLSGSITGPAPATLKPYLVAFRYGYSPSVFELWIDHTLYTGSLSGVAPTSSLLTNLQSSAGYLGSYGHIQVYVGADTAFNSTHLAAQVAMAWNGLERQTTGERVNTILNYAGVDSTLRDIDRGCSVMQRAQFAGQTPLDVLQEARRTEQGRLFMRGNRVQFHDRRRINNI